MDCANGEAELEMPFAQLNEVLSGGELYPGGPDMRGVIGKRSRSNAGILGGGTLLPHPVEYTERKIFVEKRNRLFPSNICVHMTASLPDAHERLLLQDSFE